MIGGMPLIAFAVAAEAQDSDDRNEGFRGEKHPCKECGEDCFCEYNPCVCCDYNW